MPGNRFYGVFFDMGAITPERVKRARQRFATQFGIAATVLVAGKQREGEARAAAQEQGLAVEARGGIIGGEFWLGGEDGAPSHGDVQA